MTSVEGHCSCGALRFRLHGDARFVTTCHCENCRRAHGAGAVEWAGYQEEQLEMLGDAASLGAWETPTGATRSFCRVCASPLFFRAPRWRGEVHVAAAALVESPGKAPAARVYVDRAPAWLPVPDDGSPRFGGEDGLQPLTDLRTDESASSSSREGAKP